MTKGLCSQPHILTVKVQREYSTNVLYCQIDAQQGRICSLGHNTGCEGWRLKSRLGGACGARARLRGATYVDGPILARVGGRPARSALEPQIFNLAASAGHRAPEHKRTPQQRKAGEQRWRAARIPCNLRFPAAKAGSPLWEVLWSHS